MKGPWGGGGSGAAALVVAMVGCGGQAVVDVPVDSDAAAGGAGATASSSGAGAKAGAGGAGAGAGSGEPACVTGSEWTVLAPSEVATVFLDRDDQHIYWSDEAAVRRVPVDGGSAETLATSPLFPMGVAVDETSVYWTTHAGEAIYRTPKQGGDTFVLADNASGGADAMVLVDDQFVYYRVSTSTLGRVPKQGGDAIPVVTEQQALRSFALDDGWLYYIDAGAVERVPKGGGAPQMLASADEAAAGSYTGGTRALAVDDSAVYWMSADQGSVATVAKDGGAVTVLATGIVNGQDVTVDDAYLYWTENWTLMKVPKQGGSPIVIAADGSLMQPLGVVVDERYAYFTNYVGQGPVVRVCK